LSLARALQIIPVSIASSKKFLDASRVPIACECLGSSGIIKEALQLARYLDREIKGAGNLLTSGCSGPQEVMVITSVSMTVDWAATEVTRPPRATTRIEVRMVEMDLRRVEKWRMRV
jgi:hypothetical protein